MSIDIHALSGAYAVDALDGVERAEFERHLAECPSCQHEDQGLREAAATLTAAVASAPPQPVRDAVLRAIATVRPLPPVVPTAKVGRTRRWWAAGSLVLAASMASAVAISQPSPPAQSSTAAAAQVMTAADVQVMHSTISRGGSLIWYRSQAVGRAVVTSRDLEPLPATQVYELWLERPDHTMAPAGFMASGAATVVLSGQASTAVAAGVTIEPSAGSDKPTTLPLAWVPFVGARWS